MNTLLSTLLYSLLLFAACHDPDFFSQPKLTDLYISVTTPLADPLTVDRQPVVIRYGEVAYPRFARDAGLEGTVVISAHVTDIGNVDTTLVIESSGTPSMDDAVVMAAMQYKYRPAIYNGRAVECWVSYTVIFDLP